MKTEIEKIRDLEIKACHGCRFSTFDPQQLTCVCSIKGEVEIMSCCGQFKERG